MKKILVASFILFSLVCKGQDSTVKSSLIFTSSPVYFDSVFVGSTELIYAPGISWTESDNQDSIIKIQIEGDTMIIPVQEQIFQILKKGGFEINLNNKKHY